MQNHSATTLLDGAMGSALRARGVEVPSHETSVWSALALVNAPSEIIALHRDYIRAGADVITINNYAVTPISLAREGLTARLEELTLAACDLAERARAQEAASVKIAGSLPPLNTSYRPDLVGRYEHNLSDYRMLAGLLAPHVDILICETMTTAAEARAAAQAGVETGLPVWVCWTLSDDPVRLRGGEEPADAVAQLSDLPVAAFLFNCSSTGAIAEALPGLKMSTQCPIGAYANPFRCEPLDGDYSIGTPNWLSPREYAETGRAWVDAGAAIIGGCCCTDPSYVTALNRMRQGLDPLPKDIAEGSEHAS